LVFSTPLLWALSMVRVAARKSSCAAWTSFCSSALRTFFTAVRTVERIARLR